MYSYNKLYFQYRKLYSSYLKKITKILNDYHNKRYDKDYWEPIIGLYLRRLIINFLFLHKKKKNFFKDSNFKKINFYKSFTDFISNNDYLFYKFKNIKDYEYYKIKKIDFFSEKSNSLNTILSNFLIKFGITKVFFQKSYLKKNLKILFTLRSFFYFKSLPFLKSENYKIEKKAIFKNRMNLIKIFETNNKKDFILQNIILSMPVNYIEGYDLILKEVQKINLSKALYIDGNEVKFDFIKFYIAELILNKKKIFTGQHSFRSGIEDFDVHFDYSKSISNYYLTWGWDDKSDLILKYSSTRLFSSSKKYQKVNHIDNNQFNICFILCSYSKIGECLPDNFDENFKIEISRMDLLEKIRKKNRCKVSLKPREGSFLINNKKNFYNKFSILKEKSRMYEIFGNYQVVLFEKLSLGVAECMYLNQPTIFYYPKNLYKQKNKKYNELLSLLKKAKIYFDNKNEVLELLSSKKNIYLWWTNRNNIKNRKKVLEKFANCFNYKDLNRIKKII